MKNKSQNSSDIQKDQLNALRFGLDYACQHIESTTRVLKFVIEELDKIRDTQVRTHITHGEEGQVPEIMELSKMILTLKNHITTSNSTLEISKRRLAKNPPNILPPEPGTTDTL